MSDHLEDHRSWCKDDSTGSIDFVRRKQSSQQPRQLLSCTKCRERKVKCDRTKPCSACCARGQPKDCHFVAEGGDYTPIQQSYELRKLRAENLRLKERLRASKIPIEEEYSDPAVSPESWLGDRPISSQKRRAAKQRRFQGSEWQDSLYFGSPGLARVVTDFAAINIPPKSTSLAHLVPRGPDMYSPKNAPPYPFPTFFKATPEECIPQLLQCLPPIEDLLDCLSAFEKRVNACSFPYVPFEISKVEVERFLSDARKHAQMCPDMLALLFAAMALGGQHSVWDRSGGQWNGDDMLTESQKGDVYIAASMQALRLASFMNRPSLLGIQALIMIGPYLTNSGRFLDAWTLFGTTIRLAHSIGLHRHSKYLDPTPPTPQECSIRQTLWWWMMHMDEEYSMTLGRPLGISGIGDCPPPHELTTDPHMLRLSEFVNYFTILARQILSSDRLTNTKIDEFTDSLRGLLDTMPELLQFDKSWIREGYKVPEWPMNAIATIYYCKTHTYLILLNRQRTDRPKTQHQCPGINPPAASFRSVNRTPLSQPSPTASTEASLRGRALVLASSEDILDAFLFLYLRVPAAMITWTMGQQAFNSCMLLLLDALEQSRVTSGACKVEKAFEIFQAHQSVHKLAELAVEKIGWGLKELRHVTEASPGTHEPPKPYSGDGKMQGPGRKVSQGSCAMYEETVMGASGMLLLEDPGLQKFEPEPFAPIAWNIAGAERTLLYQLKRERGRLGDETSQQTESLDSTSSEEDLERFRSSEGMQGVRRSTTMRSAPTRCATPALDDLQPLGVTGPTSHTSLAEPTHCSHQPSQTAVMNDRPQQNQSHPLQQFQLADDARGSAWKARPATAAFDTAHLDFSIAPGLQKFPAIQLRHNSCPSIPHPSASAPPLLRSTYTSSSAPSARSPPSKDRHPSEMSEQAPFHAFVEGGSQTPSSEGSIAMYPSWTASSAGRPAVTMLDTFDLSGLSNPNQTLPGSAQIAGQQQHFAYSVPMQFPQATSLTVPMAMEQMTMDEWKRWIERSECE